jgi:hypothetical protein
MIQKQITYKRGNSLLQDQYTLKSQNGQVKPVIMRKRIGSTTYRVNVHFSETSRETMNDKVSRMIHREVESEVGGS